MELEKYWGAEESAAERKQERVTGWGCTVSI